VSPFIVKCGKCDEVLREAGYRLDSNYMEETIKRFSGKCPRCGHPLRLPPKNVEVKPNPAFKRGYGSGKRKGKRGDRGVCDYPQDC